MKKAGNQSEFSQAVYALVRHIPRGRVMTYGQIAACLGQPRAAQQVGWALHWAEFGAVPYQRVVNRFGGLAGGYPRGGQLGHRFDLETVEGISVRDNMTIDLDKYLWHPSPATIPRLKSSARLQALEVSSRH